MGPQDCCKPSTDHCKYLMSYKTEQSPFLDDEQSSLNPGFAVVVVAGFSRFSDRKLTNWSIDKKNLLINKLIN